MLNAVSGACVAQAGEDGEVCDDGGESVSCNADCSLAQCGDQIINNTAGEHCDEGEETAFCNTNCSIASCRDGIINTTAGEDSVY